MANKIISAVSILIYLITLILSIIEITKAKILYDETCSAWSCWAIFIVVWALAIPVSVFSIVREIAVLSLTRRRRRAELTRPAVSTGGSRLALWSAVVIWALWLVVLVIGWAPIRFSRTITDDDFVAQDNGNFAGGLDYVGPAPDITGMFLYIRKLYEAIMPYYENSLGTTDLFVFVRAGYGAAIMATISFAWSFLNIIFEFATQHGPRGQLARSKV